MDSQEDSFMLNGDLLYADTSNITSLYSPRHSSIIDKPLYNGIQDEYFPDIITTSHHTSDLDIMDLGDFRWLESEVSTMNAFNDFEMNVLPNSNDIVSFNVNNNNIHISSGSPQPFNGDITYELDNTPQDYYMVTTSRSPQSDNSSQTFTSGSTIKTRGTELSDDIRDGNEYLSYIECDNFTQHQSTTLSSPSPIFRRDEELFKNSKKYRFVREGVSGLSVIQKPPSKDNRKAFLSRKGYITFPGYTKLSNIERVDTKEVAKKVTEELKKFNIPQTIFAKIVIGRSQGTLSDLLRNPKDWDQLKSGRETFYRMAKWLEEPMESRISPLQVATEKRKAKQLGKGLKIDKNRKDRKRSESRSPSPTKNSIKRSKISVSECKKETTELEKAITDNILGKIIKVSVGNEGDGKSSKNTTCILKNNKCNRSKRNVKIENVDPNCDDIPLSRESSLNSVNSDESLLQVSICYQTEDGIMSSNPISTRYGTV
uniref:Homeobox protein onecut (inferred by orthology to a D. melanogaster protein) n=1 Tax=Strongyloides venezuelensis TaxID=75913 RepID=A0A0K0EX09_STRVS